MADYIFSIDDYGLKRGYDLVSSWDMDSLEYVAEDAASYYHDEYDGHEDSWPVVFEIWTIEGESLGKFLVYREYDPTFVATKIEEGEANDR